MRTPEPLIERRVQGSQMRTRHRVSSALTLEKRTGVWNLHLTAEGTVNV
jgi:hypothetical protein